MQLYYRRVDALNLITREHLMNLVLVIRDKGEEKRRLKMVSFNRINTTRSLTIYYYLEFGPWADAVRSNDPRHKTSGTHRSPYDE